MKRTARRTPVRTKGTDLGSWNFVIFLTLALILLVSVLSIVNRTAKDLRIRARLDCPDVSRNMPRPEDCPGGKWTFSRDATGCPAFICE